MNRNEEARRAGLPDLLAFFDEFASHSARGEAELQRRHSAESGCPQGRPRCKIGREDKKKPWEPNRIATPRQEEGSSSR